ncbi:hypothetical protein D3C77_359690 [compost metagenome]
MEQCRVQGGYRDLVGKLTSSVETAGGRVLGASSRIGLAVSVKNEEIVVYPELHLATQHSIENEDETGLLRFIWS